MESVIQWIRDRMMSVWNKEQAKMKMTYRREMDEGEVHKKMQ